MHILKRIFIAALFAMASFVPAHAAENPGKQMRDPEIAREWLDRLYRLEQAFLTCDHVTPTGADLLRLDNAIIEAERSSGLAESDLDSIRDQIEDIAVAAPGDFCAGAGDAVAGMREIAYSAGD